MNKEVKFKDLSFSLKFAVVGGFISLVLIILVFLEGFFKGLGF